jgi:hypothetical protein
LIDQSFAEYHREGGNVVFFHDVFWNPHSEPPRWRYFQSHIGLHTMYDSKYSGKVKWKGAADERPAIFARPFALPDPFSVSEFHTNQMYDAEKAILVSVDDQKLPYYTEYEGIGICEAGHTPETLTDAEKQFLVNVTCHLSVKRPRIHIE